MERSPIKWVMNTMPETDDKWLDVMSLSEAQKVRAFHCSFPQYAPTPLSARTHMAKRLGLRGLFVKDESHRFGLNAFKVLGGSYAIASEIARSVGRDISQTDYAYLTGEDFKKEFAPATFFTATDGNHGRGVAWSARVLGQRAVVLMPKGTVKSRFDNIAKEGAQVTIEDANYDECVRRACALAKEVERGVVVQDTAWPGYEEIPCRIMQGYATMAAEAADQLREAGVDHPTHVFVQAGVGSLAGAIAGYYANLYGENCPKIVVMEADAADCHYQSALAGDGGVRIVTGDLNTMMAGLACGEPNPISFDILKNHAACFVSCPDWVSAAGMRLLAAGDQGDAPIVSGESGAIGTGLVHAIMTDPAYANLRDALGLGKESVVLLFSTEGATDPENYRRIVDVTLGISSPNP
ncbi:MAG: diaminopropionate ammonia-lyase [Clostridiales bacterium]|nr:diaminopropionate ammonia-lyase [Clostridiales bacterium]